MLRVGLPASSPGALDMALVEGGGAGNVVEPSLGGSGRVDSVSDGLGVTAGVRLSSSVSRLIGLGGLLLHA